MGRKRTQMDLIEKENPRQVTFSKRRSGLFKKASELCTLCAAEVGIILFSIGGKALSFGHPSVHSVFNRLCPGNPGVRTSQNEVGQDPGLQDLNKTYSDLLEHLQLERTQGKKRRQTIEEKTKPAWLHAPTDSLSLEELYKIKGALEEVKVRARKDKEKLLALAQPSSSSSIG